MISGSQKWSGIMNIDLRLDPQKQETRSATNVVVRPKTLVSNEIYFPYAGGEGEKSFLELRGLTKSIAPRSQFLALRVYWTRIVTHPKS